MDDGREFPCQGGVVRCLRETVPGAGRFRSLRDESDRRQDIPAPMSRALRCSKSRRTVAMPVCAEGNVRKTHQRRERPGAAGDASRKRDAAPQVHAFVRRGTVRRGKWAARNRGPVAIARRPRRRPVRQRDGAVRCIRRNSRRSTRLRLADAPHAPDIVANRVRDRRSRGPCDLRRRPKPLPCRHQPRAPRGFAAARTDQPIANGAPRHRIAARIIPRVSPLPPARGSRRDGPIAPRDARCTRWPRRSRPRRSRSSGPPVRGTATNRPPRPTATA